MFAKNSLELQNSGISAVPVPSKQRLSRGDLEKEPMVQAGAFEEHKGEKATMKSLRIFSPAIAIPAIALSAILCLYTGGNAGGDETVKEFKVYPIGHIRKSEQRTTIVIDKKYEAGLLRLEDLSHIWVLWWFDRNDTPEKRAILRVHPRGNPDNPLTGVFATHAPVRPNLIAMTRCKVIAVEGNVIEIESIDAFTDTPVLDIKS
jgi:tRNA-Thr(GGU) m(6)t(6)A37 methyltransferase TsaA